MAHKITNRKRAVILPDFVGHGILDETIVKFVGSWLKPALDELINKFDELHAVRIRAIKKPGDSLAEFNDILDRNIDNPEE